MVVYDPKIDATNRLSHRADFADVVQQEPWRVHHAVEFDQADVEPLLELAPDVCWASGGENDAHRVVPIVRLWRLLHEDREHAAERVELHSLVLSAIVPEPRGTELLGQRQLRP